MPDRPEVPTDEAGPSSVVRPGLDGITSSRMTSGGIRSVVQIGGSGDRTACPSVDSQTPLLLRPRSLSCHVRSACTAWRVLPEDLALVLFAERREPLVGQGFGVGPGRLRVRVVARPHDVVDPDVVALAQADRVLHEGAEHLPAEVEARWLLQLALRPVPVLLPQVVGVVLEERDPADLALDRDELESG